MYTSPQQHTTCTETREVLCALVAPVHSLLRSLSSMDSHSTAYSVHNKPDGVVVLVVVVEVPRSLFMVRLWRES